MKRIFFYLIILFVISAAAHILFRTHCEPFLESLLRERIFKEMDAVRAEEIFTDIDLSLPRIMKGSIDSFTIEIRGYYADDLRVDRVYIEAEDISLDVQGLLSGKANVKGVGRSSAVVELCEADINEYLNGKYGSQWIFAFRLLGESAQISLSLRGFGERVDLALDGDFKVGEENSLSFRISDLLIKDMGIRLPAGIEEFINGYVDLKIGLSELPLGLVLKEAEIDNGILRLFGSGSLP